VTGSEFEEDNNMRFKLAMIVAAFFVSVVAGSVQAAPPTNACSLLTPAQVSEVVGASVGAGAPLFPTNTKDCQWRTTGTGAKILVQIFLKDPQAFVYIKTPVPGVTKVAASGIGDDALYSSAGRTPSVLSVKKGDAVFNVHVLSSGLADDKVKAMEKTLALKVLAKL
jgi:hypothetical protein